MQTQALEIDTVQGIKTDNHLIYPIAQILIKGICKEKYEKDSFWTCNKKCIYGVL